MHDWCLWISSECVSDVSFLSNYANKTVTSNNLYHIHDSVIKNNISVIPPQPYIRSILELKSLESVEWSADIVSNLIFVLYVYGMTYTYDIYELLHVRFFIFFSFLS